MAFKRLDTLAMHRDRHFNIMRFKCSECPAAFRQRNTLADHMRVHRRNGKWKCTLCTASYSTGIQFKNHCRLVHKLTDSLDDLKRNAEAAEAEAERLQNAGAGSPEHPAELGSGREASKDVPGPDAVVAVADAVPQPREPEVV